MGTADSYALCPFFRCTNGGRSIGCEGPTDGATLLLTFPSEGAQSQYKHHKCDMGYRNCPVYRWLMEEKYKEEPG